MGRAAIELRPYGHFGGGLNSSSPRTRVAPTRSVWAGWPLPPAASESSRQETLNPLDVDQWCFYVVPTAVLENRVRSQYSITLPSLEKISTSIGYCALRDAVRNPSKHPKPDGLKLLKSRTQ